MKKGDETKARMVEAAAAVFEKEGFSGAGLNAILEASGAPRGSLYFHFPGGKEELAIAAIHAAKDALLAEADVALRGARSASAALSRFVKRLADRLEAADFDKGCPIASVAGTSSSAPASVRKAASDALTELEARLAAALVEHGVPPRAAAKRAPVALAAIEGALVLGRIHRSTEPLLRVARSFGDVLDHD